MQATSASATMGVCLCATAMPRVLVDSGSLLKAPNACAPWGKLLASRPLLLRVVASIPFSRDEELQQWSHPLSDLSGKKDPQPTLALSHVFLIARRTTTRASRR